MKLALVELDESWAVRERSVVVQSLDALPHYARSLVEDISASQRTQGA
jgi:hypothetical protein